MICSYCGKVATYLFNLLEYVVGPGPSVRHACFPCIQTIGEKVMKSHGQAQAGSEGEARPDVTASCRKCPGCGGVRREHCTNFGLHGHEWCDCQ